MTTAYRIVCLLAIAFVALFGGCATVPQSPAAKDSLHDAVASTITDLTLQNPSIQHDLDTAYAYTVFPDVGEGAFVLGGAFGNGEVYEHGKFVGYGSVSQANIGAQIGGQSHNEIIFFQNKDAFDSFKADKLAFDSKASIVGEAGGTTADSRFHEGVRVLINSQFGLMAQAAVGGQKFRFVPAAPPSAAIAEP